MRLNHHIRTTAALALALSAVAAPAASAQPKLNPTDPMAPPSQTSSAGGSGTGNSGGGSHPDGQGGAGGGSGGSAIAFSSSRATAAHPIYDKNHGSTHTPILAARRTRCSMAGLGYGDVNDELQLNDPHFRLRKNG